MNTFVAVEGQEGGNQFVLLVEDARIPEKPEVFGLGGQRRDWIEPVERFVSSLEERGLKLRYGGTFVGDYNQVLRSGGIFGYPALKNKLCGSSGRSTRPRPWRSSQKGPEDTLSTAPGTSSPSHPRPSPRQRPSTSDLPGSVREVESLIKGA